MKRVLIALGVVFCGLSAAEVKADDPRMDRLVSVLERMDERLTRMEARMSAYEGGGGGRSYESPASFRSSTPIRRASYRQPVYEDDDEEMDFGGNYRGGYGAGPIRVIVIRNCDW